MPITRRAVIDIGTNSVKLLVADVNGRNVAPLIETSEQTRLGKDFYQTHRLQPEAISKTAMAVASFAERARQSGVERPRVIATSAARDAINQAELIRAVEEASGLRMEVISGEQEADWTFAGVMTNAGSMSRPVLILDVGGGSSEFILGHGSVRYFRESFRLGSVRLLEQIQPSDPPRASDWEACRSWLEDFLAAEIRPALAAPLQKRGEPVQLVGTGGAASLLACMELKSASFDREKIESARLTQEMVWEHQRRLWGLPLAERKNIVGLSPNRADVILTGVAIIAIVMREFAFSDLRVSTRGLRFAAIHEFSFDFPKSKA
jgi:exopolyphosphatase / guanosine-5'-triphosphate,3'-diphosphate pyrophosphatase